MLTFLSYPVSYPTLSTYSCLDWPRVVLFIFHYLFFFFFSASCTPSIPGSHSSHLAHRRSTHSHSYLFYHLRVPRRKADFSGMHFYSSLDSLSSDCQKKERKKPDFGLFIWVLIGSKICLRDQNYPKIMSKISKV